MANIIAIVWDFDKTLINGYMEDPVLKDYGIDPKDFWAEVSGLPEKYHKEQGVKVNPDTIYLNQLINYAKNGKMPGLNNAKLRRFLFPFSSVIPFSPTKGRNSCGDNSHTSVIRPFA